MSNSSQENHRPLSELQNEIGYIFKNQDLLDEAFKHPSLGKLKKKATANKTSSYASYYFERMEFLGDRVLGLVIARWLFDEFPDEAEGIMAKRHARLVCREMLSDIAKKLKLLDYLCINPLNQELRSEQNQTVLSDTCEVLIACLYLDGGFEVAESFIKTYWRDFIHLDILASMDPKSALQEWSQAQGLGLPEYRVLGVSGSDHAPIFTIEIVIQNLPTLKVTGPSKKIAEKNAAQEMLTYLKKSST